MQIALRILCAWLCTSLMVSPLEAVTKEDLPILKCGLNRHERHKAKVAICAMFRDEAPFLKEWIEFHRLIGVKHFYLYNNCSQDDFWGVLKPYVEAGIVELFNVPFDSSVFNDGAATHNAVQVICYNHALKMAKGYNNWLAIIDSDEFICPVKKKSLPRLLEKYKKAPGVILYWQIFGTSNVWDLLPGELMVEKLLLKYPNVGGQALYKSIVQPKLATCTGPHSCSYKKGKPVIEDRSSFVPGQVFYPKVPTSILRINHYTYRTDLFYYNVKKPRREQWGDRPDPELERKRLDGANNEYDPVMLQYVPELHNRMNGPLLF